MESRISGVTDPILSRQRRNLRGQQLSWDDKWGQADPISCFNLALPDTVRQLRAQAAKLRFEFLNAVQKRNH